MEKVVKAPEKAKKRSSNDNHPYMNGFKFWNEMRFWDSDYHSQKAKDYFEKSLNRMLKGSTKHTTLSNTIR